MKKTAMLLTLAILLCICSCLSARALEDTRTSQLLVGSVLGDESEKCYFYSAPEESKAEIAGFYYPGAQVYILEYGPEWCQVFLSTEGYMKTSHLNISNATDKIKSIGFAFVSFEASDPFVDPNGFIELLGDCDLDKPGDVISNGMALKLIGNAGEFLQVQYGNYDGFILSRHASVLTYESMLLLNEEPRILAAGDYTVGEDLPSGLWRISAQQGNGAIVKILSSRGNFIEHRISGKQNASYSVLLPMQMSISLSDQCLFTPISSINVTNVTNFISSNGRQICGIDFIGAPDVTYKILADDVSDAYYIVSTLMQDISLDIGERHMLQAKDEIIIRLNDGYVLDLHNCSLIDTTVTSEIVDDNAPQK